MGGYVKRLLVGGSRAGEMVEVDENRDYLRIFPTLPRISKAFYLGETAPRGCTVKMEEYHLVPVQCDDKLTEVFVLKGLNVLQQLVAGYRPVTWVYDEEGASGY